MCCVQGIFIKKEKEARLIQPWKLNHSIKAETSIAWIVEEQAAFTALTAKLHQSQPRGDGFKLRVALHLCSCTKLGLTECLPGSASCMARAAALKSSGRNHQTVY